MKDICRITKSSSSVLCLLNTRLRNMVTGVYALCLQSRVGQGGRHCRIWKKHTCKFVWKQFAGTHFWLFLFLVGADCVYWWSCIDGYKFKQVLTWSTLGGNLPERFSSLFAFALSCVWGRDIHRYSNWSKTSTEHRGVTACPAHWLTDCLAVLASCRQSWKVLEFKMVGMFSVCVFSWRYCWRVWVFPPSVII